MTDAELLSQWYLILGIAGVLVAVVAALLIAVMVTARRIARAALRCHQAVGKIAEHTQVIWTLESTNAVAFDLRETAKSIRRHAEEIAEALQAPAGPRA
ncbi:MAG: hypothetical protein QN183_03300 [Armatimonadota bacterium]|nr:hypothetical protein [Armatimonadota bacterium]MDR7486748.1 hypothetical protein [Armatimonadota bacterium]MDR7534272.1 hypothetical protein [Armatimonadota bacterium]MDR7535377.1 hypothetical protein [Armatimonadota bacterium]